ncbi:MAG: iron ABC transporter permease [Desulfuromonadales bacterium]|nr:iron ABC transporter permease [Desulfuromonadales bacterium]
MPEGSTQKRGAAGITAVPQLLKPSGWQLATGMVAVLIVVPLSVLLLAWLEPAWEIWRHLRETLLSRLLLNSLILVLGVGSGTLLLGVSLAWLTGACDFPGRRIFSWALLLPLAMPTYVLAFVFLGLFDFSGPVQTQLRDWFGTGVWFPNIRSAFGVVLVMSLALYPYVYLLARNAFQTQGKRGLEAAEILGCTPTRGFFRVVLPMARPWIAGGTTLVLMETLADFGAVSIFNYNTFTTAIYKTWFGFFSLPAAAQLSSLLVAMIFIFIAIEQKMRSRMRFSHTRLSVRAERVRLNGWQRYLATGYALTILLVAFLLPALQLLSWTIDIFAEEFDSRYLELLGHSLGLGLSAALLISCVALLLAYAGRRHRDHLTGLLVRVATLGYALPGTVLAVGIFIPLASLDNLLIDLTRHLFGVEIAPLLQGTIAVMLVAYLVRFMAAGYKPIDSAMHRVTGNIDEASRLMGLRGLRLLTRVHLPMLRGGIFTALTLVFVDVMKEMPITLMTRPFGWDTLAVKIFELTSEGEWERAALPALTLLLTGLIPIVVLMRGTER